MHYIWHQKVTNKSIQFQPQLLINSALVPQVKANESFRYLGRYYDFGMSNEVHKEELISTVTETISQIDRLALHPRNKLRACLYIPGYLGKSEII